MFWSKQLDRIEAKVDALVRSMGTVLLGISTVANLLKGVIVTQAELKDALNNAGNTTPEVDAALKSLQDQAKVVDDLVPDAAPANP